MPILPEAKRQALERSYRYGRSSWKAAEAAEVTPRTSAKFYRLFLEQKIPRLKRDRRSPHKLDYDCLPAYDGPTMIGKAIDEPPVPEHDGNWIF